MSSDWYALLPDALKAKAVEYTGNECKKLFDLTRLHCRGLAIGIDNKSDFDEFYDVALETLTLCLKNYRNDKGATFDTFLSMALSRKIKSLVTKRNRLKRSATVISLNDEITDDSEDEFGDLVANGYDLERSVIGKLDGERKARKYVSTLSRREKEVLSRLLAEQTTEQIRDEMGITRREFEKIIRSIRNNDKIRLLRNGKTCMPNKEKVLMNEKSKIETITTSQLCELFESNYYCPDHPLQRQSGLWDNAYKGAFIVSLLHGYTVPPIIICEESVDDYQVRWLIDGKQRCSTLSSYFNNEFAISKKCEMTTISCSVPKLDADGREIKSSRGYTEMQIVTFDVAGKKFKDLPAELQAILRKANITTDLYLNCSEDEIEYHIRRFNNSKAMNKAQKGVTYIGTGFAKVVSNIASRSFFVDNNFLTTAEKRNSGDKRIVVETIMATYFLDNWKKSTEQNAAYLKANAESSQFDHLDDLVDELEGADLSRVPAGVFDLKHCFMWLTAYDRFRKTYKRESADRFIDFAIDFLANKATVEYDGTTYDYIDKEKGTKDTVSIKAKLNLIFHFMDEYFGCYHSREFTLDDNTKAYVEEFAAGELGQYLNITDQTELTRVAMKCLMVTDGSEEFDDETIEEELETAFHIKSDSVDTTLTIANAMAEFMLETKGETELFSPENVPALFLAYSDAWNDDLDDDFGKWLPICANRFDVDYYDRFTGNTWDDGHVLIEAFKSYLDYESKKAV